MNSPPTSIPNLLLLAGIAQEQQQWHAPENVMTPERTHEGMVHGHGMEC